MAENVLAKYSNDELMAMDKKQIVELAREIGKLPELLALFDMKVEKKRHKNRVLKPSKNPKLNGKLTWQADTSEEPEIVVEDAGFFEIKAKFIHDICALPYTEKEDKEDSFKALVLAAIAAEGANAAAPVDNIEKLLEETK